MNSIKINIDGSDYSVDQSQPLRKVLLDTGIYIPGICNHPDLDAFKPFDWSERVWQGERMLSAPSIIGSERSYHCNLCMVSIDGGAPQRSCDAQVSAGMSVRTATPEVVAARRNALKKILARHPHACLTCPQRNGCDRIQCSMNVPVSERCCELLGRCEIGKVAEWIGIPNDTPAYHNEGRPAINDEALFLRDYELCIGCTRCVRICRDVREVDILGAISGPTGISVGTTGGPTLEKSLCRFCGACVEACPTGALRDRPGVKPLVGSLAPCSARCPLEIDVPGYMELIAEGRNFDALELIRERAVLPGVLGYACFHPCEENCRRESLDASASICALKRYVSDVAGNESPRIIKNEPTGKRIAVIGGGPAGLAAAADLLRFGYEVVVFEQADSLGGMLRQTIPDFRLPDEVIDRDLKYLLELGLQTKFGVAFGSQLSLDDLRRDDFKAIVVSVGLGEAVCLGVEGEDLPEVKAGLYLLRDAARCEAKELSGKVLVIGGGAVAIDAAMTARRLGAENVAIVCLEAENEMPAHPEEIRFAREEGITISNGWGVERFDPSPIDGIMVTLKKCLSVFDTQGKFNPKYDVSVQSQIEAGWVIPAIGQKRGLGIEELKSASDVFMAGDFHKGATSIVEAMADGRKTALQVDKFLGGSGQLPVISTAAHDARIGKDKDFHHRKRISLTLVDPDVRVNSMSPFVPTMTPEEALSEARRCLRCHLRARITPPVLPPDLWHPVDSEILGSIPDCEGVLILADESKKTVRIAGSANLRKTFGELLSEGIAAKYCHWEADPMFTKRESELIQAHLQAFGEMPGAADLDDLF